MIGDPFSAGPRAAPGFGSTVPGALLLILAIILAAMVGMHPGFAH
jgi:hypothetical protein